MHQINHAVVRGGQVLLSDLPFADGQEVQISVVELAAPPAPRLSIAEARRLVQGSGDLLGDPSEPMIPVEDWEMLR